MNHECQLLYRDVRCEQYECVVTIRTNQTCLPFLSVTMHVAYCAPVEYARILLLCFVKTNEVLVLSR